jgi:protein-L-isoaspartate(D-aspartate) O-methyltransferase
MVIGRLLTEAGVGSGDRVLLVGAGTGYTAELLGRLAGSVVALEEEPSLLALAREAILADNVQLVEGPLSAGWAEGAPYDLIVIDGAVDAIPQALIDQLADGGRLAAGLVDEGGVTRLAIGRRGGAGFGTISFADASTPVLSAFARAAEFSF